MDIGEPVREIEVIPAEEPIPEPAEVPDGEPDGVPA